MPEPDIDRQLNRIRQHAERLYHSRKYMCAESVLVAVNEGLGGGLDESRAVSLAAPFSIGIGGGGCLCGALSGGIMATGLFLGNGDAYRYRKRSRRFARLLHDRFKQQFGSTCCRVLCRKVKHDRRMHFQHCADMTADTAVMVARLILEQQPERLAAGGTGDRARRPSALTAMFRRLIGRG